MGEKQSRRPPRLLIRVHTLSEEVTDFAYRLQEFRGFKVFSEGDSIAALRKGGVNALDVNLLERNNRRSQLDGALSDLGFAKHRGRKFERALSRFGVRGMATVDVASFDAVLVIPQNPVSYLFPTQEPRALTEADVMAAVDFERLRVLSDAVRGGTIVFCDERDLEAGLNWIEDGFKNRDRVRHEFALKVALLSCFHFAVMGTWFEGPRTFNAEALEDVVSKFEEAFGPVDPLALANDASADHHFLEQSSSSSNL